MPRWPPTARPESPLQLVVAAVLVATAVFVAIYLPRAISALGDNAANNASLSYSDREVAGGNGIVVDQAAVYEARGLIPPGAKYRVVTGSGVKDPTNLTPLFVDAWYRSFLMPRRPAADARWIICYGCDVAKLGGHYTVVWQDDRGISVGRIS
jgi:hypothetical protein